MYRYYALLLAVGGVVLLRLALRESGGWQFLAVFTAMYQLSAAGVLLWRSSPMGGR